MFKVKCGLIMILKGIIKNAIKIVFFKELLPTPRRQGFSMLPGLSGN